ncbi:immunoglobulin lambda-1 light chain-like [Hypanus sabinus]|uniref:immunoglobulin lambda-1 light chain-like n=1 Tax=Hypanus sabinus TaxID=79690 RepID=UPI0028C47C6D|nr:immunoglobulin lambda-1 light chain-like [Hypanus sabinus]XP_059839178.1 immunoglobulin lambda-1 light chain-like [Hypanus sabinus]
MSGRVGVILIICVAYSNAEITLNQEGSLSVQPRGTVKIGCRVSGTSLGNSDIAWYQQKPDGAPRFLLYHDLNRDSKGTGIPDRFSGRSQSSSNAAFLTISNVQLEDDADYYCGWWKSDALHFGGGTQLTVTGGKLTRPSITLLPPASKQISEGQKATLVCLVNNFSPRSAEVSWEMDGKTVKAGVLTTRTVQNSDQTYSLSSYLTLTASEWNSHEEYTCGVTHQSLGSPLKRSIQKSGCA